MDLWNKRWTHCQDCLFGDCEVNFKLPCRISTYVRNARRTYGIDCELKFILCGKVIKSSGNRLVDCLVNICSEFKLNWNICVENLQDRLWIDLNIAFENKQWIIRRLFPELTLIWIVTYLLNSGIVSELICTLSAKFELFADYLWNWSKFPPSLNCLNIAFENWIVACLLKSNLYVD